MSPTKKDGAPSSVFPVLFMSVEGEPMSFYLRPGPLKRQLKQLITTGGGTVSNVQLPGSILLIDPKENCSIPESATHRYVSTQYIHDCVEKNEQLNLEDYRLNPKLAQRQSARLNSRDSSPYLSEGRIPYTSQEDAAILEYVTKHKSQVGGNRLWKDMEQQRLTAHSWQSMKYRYQVRLAKNQTADEAQTTQNKEEEAEEKAEDPDVQKPEEESASSQKHPDETDPRQVEEQSVPAGGKLENQGDEEDELQAGEPPAETSDTPRAEDPPADVQTEGDVGAEETVQPGGDVPQSQSAASPETPLRSSNRKLKEKNKVSPGLESSQHQTTRRPLELEATSPQPHGKKPQSSSSTPSPGISEEVESVVKSIEQEDGRSGEPPPKKSRRNTASPPTESESEGSDEPHMPETQQSDESDSEERREAKKKKRLLGILELAAKEFDCESNEDEPSDVEGPAEAATQSLPPPSDGYQDTRPALQPSSVSPAAAEPVLPPPLIAESTDAWSRAHLFIFDSESQELEELSVSAAPPHRPPAGGAAALSLSQVQLEDDMQLMKELMTQSQQDLETVTKALLKTSGDSSAALELLLDPSSTHGPFWSRADDDSLLSSDPNVLQQLRDKYGEEQVAKRIVFLEVER